MGISNWNFNFISVFRNFLCLNNFIKFKLKEEMQHKFTILQVCISSSCAVKCFVQFWRRNACFIDWSEKTEDDRRIVAWVVSHWQRSSHRSQHDYCIVPGQNFLNASWQAENLGAKTLQRWSPFEYIFTAVLTGGPWIYSDKLMQFYCCRCSQFW